MTYRAIIIDSKSKSDRPVQFYGNDFNKVLDEAKERLKICSADAHYEIYKLVETLMERGNMKKTMPLFGYGMEDTSKLKP